MCLWSSSVYPLFKPGASSLGGAGLAARVTIQPCSSFTEVSAIIGGCSVPSAGCSIPDLSFGRSYRTRSFKSVSSWFHAIENARYKSFILLSVLPCCSCWTIAKMTSDRRQQLCIVFVSNCIVWSIHWLSVASHPLNWKHSRWTELVGVSHASRL